VQLNRDALAALEEMKAREEAERKEKEQEMADARAAAEAAAKAAAAKARLAQQELDELKKAAATGTSSISADRHDGTDSKDGISGLALLKEEDKAAMDEDDLMLPSDLFGDDLLKCLTSGSGDIDIDDSALDEAETEGGGSGGELGTTAEHAAMEEEGAGGRNAAHSELEEGLRDMLGPDFNTKDMEDILSGFVESDKREADAAVRIKTEIKTEPGLGSSATGGDAATPGTTAGMCSAQESSAATDFIKQELISSSPASMSVPVSPAGDIGSASMSAIGGPAAAMAAQMRAQPSLFGSGVAASSAAMIGRNASPIMQQQQQQVMAPQQQHPSQMAGATPMMSGVPTRPVMMPMDSSLPVGQLQQPVGGEPQQQSRLQSQQAGMTQPPGMMHQQLQQQQQQQHGSVCIHTVCLIYIYTMCPIDL
jgi:hypothetical protein